MFHPLFEAMVRKHQTEMLSAEYGIPVDDMKVRVKGISSKAFEDTMVQARIKCGIDMPGESYDMENGKPTAFLDGHRIKALEAWLQTDQGKRFLKAMSVLIGILLALAVGS